MKTKHLNKIGSICLLAVIFLTGCGQDPIQSYQEPKSNTQAFTPNNQATPNAPFMNSSAMQTPKSDTMVAAISYTETEAWFIKMMGFKEEVLKHQVSFAKLLNSLKIPGEGTKEISWTLPEGWTEKPGSGFRHATLISTEPTIEVSISKLPKAGGALLPNVNRWRGQLKLPALTEEQLKEQIFSQKKDGRDTYLINIHNPELSAKKAADDDCSNCDHHKAEKTKAEEPKVEEVKTETKTADPHAGHNHSGHAHAHFEGTTPAKSWQVQKASGMRKAAFQITAGEEKALMTVIQLSERAGDKLMNVNRWLGQVGKADIDAKALATLEKTIKISGNDAAYYRLIGKDSAILAALLKWNHQVWFFKLTAPKALAEAEEANFKKYLNSIKLGWHDGQH